MKSATPLKKCQAATLPRGAELYQCYTENFIHMKVFYGFVGQTVARVTAIVLTVEYCCIMQNSLWATQATQGLNIFAWEKRSARIVEEFFRATAAWIFSSIYKVRLIGCGAPEKNNEKCERPLGTH